MTVVRTGTGLDEDAVLAVWQAAQAGLGRRNGGTRAQRVRTGLRARDALLLVAERDGEVVGALQAGLARGDDGAVVPGLLSLTLLAVAPEAQRTGVGRALLGALLSRYPRLTAEADDDAGVAVLEAAGLRRTGRVSERGAVHLETPA